MTTTLIPAATTRSLKILVVDDDEGIRLLATKLLARAGHRVEQAVSGKTALAAVSRAKFDLLVLDILMPDVDGLEVIRALRNVAEPPRVLVTSGGGLHLDSADCFLWARKLGAPDTLMKPFTAADLIRAVDRVMAPPQA